MLRFLFSLLMLLNADFTGVDQFWSIADRLQQNIEPAPAAWDSLFATPGYAALQAREKRRAALTLGIRAALEPSLQLTRDSILATNSWTARVIRHIQTLPAQRHQLDSLRTKLGRADFLSRASANAQSLLPRGVAAKCGQPSVAFIFFLPDGRGYPTTIVADLANILAKGDAVPFFSHELTHFYYACVSAAGSPAPDTPGDSAIVSLLTKLFEESIADQHDKAPFLLNSDAEFASQKMAAGWRGYMTQYRAHFRDAAAELRIFDGALADAAQVSDARVKKVADSLAEALPLEGRPIGFYITQQIRRHGGDAALRAVVGNPVAWLVAYQHYAGIKLSQSTIQRIRAADRAKP